MRISDWSSDVCSSDLFCIDQAACAVAAHGGDHQKVGPGGQINQRGLVAVRYTNALAAVVVADVHVEACGALRNGHADSAQSDDTQFFMADFDAQGEGDASTPLMVPHVSLGVSEFACEIGRAHV